MKAPPMLKTLLAAPALIAAALMSASPLAAADARDARLPGWMAGTWMMEDGAEWSDELWTDARGGIMLGVARTGFGSQLQSWETTQIRVKPDGSVSFFAQPQGKPASEFPMVLRSDEAIEFANANHDYPQRIRYWRQGKLLMAEISRIDGSDAQRWNYRQVVPPQD
ncbi:MAG TPA: DUF6265 family protein [Novosphingobium sp.]|nr:DUF6265 family protein [Novosphingobium sp.]